MTASRYSVSDIICHCRSKKVSEATHLRPCTRCCTSDSSKAQFSCPENGDFSLSGDSPCKGAGDDGKDMGDLRWADGTAVEDDTAYPAEFDLSQNYPNPFNPVTTITFSLRESAHTTLTVYNMMGQQVSMLIDEIKEPGYYTVEWNGRDDSGRDVSTGIYIYRLISGEKVLTRRMVKMK